jgi:hypothetical protein
MPCERNLLLKLVRFQFADLLAEQPGYCSSRAAVIVTVSFHQPEAQASGFFLLWHFKCWFVDTRLRQVIP